MKTLRPILFLLSFTVGCGTSLPPTADSAKARSALQASLDAWQKGESAESLQTRSPAIHVNDFGWDNKDRLARYEILSEQTSGQSWKAKVLLTVQYANGAQMQHEATYTVDTSPSLVVVREME
jgi:hypothetical protein